MRMSAIDNPQQGAWIMSALTAWRGWKGLRLFGGGVCFGKFYCQSYFRASTNIAEVLSKA